MNYQVPLPRIRLGARSISPRLPLLLVLLLSHQVVTTLGLDSLSVLGDNDKSQASPSTRRILAYQRSSSSESSHTMKAWHCHGRSQRELVERLRQAQIIQTSAVQAAMEAVDRQYYVTSHATAPAAVSYQDAPQAIGKAQTISAPHMHAHALEELVKPLLLKLDQKNTKSVKMLDVGCGSGYLTACFGRLFQARPSTNSSKSILDPPPGGAHVFGMDIRPELVALTRNNMLKDDGDLLQVPSKPRTKPMVRLQTANGWDGWPEEAPFDVIHVGAAAATLPIQLAGQLAPGGVMVIPVGPSGGVQTLLRVERLRMRFSGAEAPLDWKDFRVTQLLGVRYVPLIEEPPSSSSSSLMP